MENKTFSMNDLQDYLKANDGKPKSGDLLLDVRTPEEFQEGHIAHSENIDHEEVASHVDHLKKYKTVYLYCRSGGRAGRATAVLNGLGVKNIVAITGSGMMHWTSAGFPTVK